MVDGRFFRWHRHAGWLWLLAAICLAIFPVSGVLAGDWPQILGPARNGQAENETLLSQWPTTGPAVLWRYKVGAGFAGPAVAGEEVYIFHRVGNSERLERLDSRTGAPLWMVDFAATYQGGINPDNGPRCVPLVHGSNVYAFGADGDLYCVARRDGAKKWSRATHNEFKADEGYFGFGSTPIALGDVLLVNVGGTPDAGIVAFSLDTGETVWQKTSERASYSSPTYAQLAGAQYAVFVTRYNALAIAPESGEVRFRFPFGKRGPTVNAATPLVFDGQLFLSSNYGVGCVLKRIDGDSPADIWSSDEVLSSQYDTAIHFENHLYGVHGREDVGTPQLRCVEATRGKVNWTIPDFGAAHLILADNKVLALKVDGTLLLIEPNSERYVPLAEVQVSNNTTRALPALAGGRLFVRDNLRDAGTLQCLIVGGQ